MEDLEKSRGGTTTIDSVSSELFPEGWLLIEPHHSVNRRAKLIASLRNCLSGVVEVALTPTPEPDTSYEV